MIAVDTNVLVYAVDQLEPLKRAKAIGLVQQLYADGSTVLLWQVAGEFLAKLRQWEKNTRLTSPEVEGYLQHVLGLFPVVLPTLRVLHLAVEIGRKHSLSHWDSMVVAGCVEAGVDTLHSEDMSDGAVYEGVQVLNPFV